MASHQTFSGQIKHMSGQIKFVQTNFLYINNETFMKFAEKSNFLLFIPTGNVDDT